MEVRCNNCNGTGKIDLPEFRCIRCGNEIPRQPDVVGNMDDGLRVEFSGGYGEYLDGRVKKELCANCVAKLKISEPWIKNMIDQYLEGFYPNV